MRQKRWKPPHKKRYIYITQSAAIPNNGIAALFHSTRLYIFAVNTAKYSNLPVCALVFMQVRVFLFEPELDKPRHYEPRCRSPPVLHFRFSKITKKESIHMSKIKNPEAYYATVVRNMDKNDFRANDNFYKHIDSVGDEIDIRKKIRDSQSGPVPYDFSIERQLCDASLQNWLMTLENDSLYNALIILPPDNLRLIYLLYARGLSQAECALFLGVKQGAVSRKHNRIKLFLKKHMSDVIKKGV